MNARLNTIKNCFLSPLLPKVAFSGVCACACACARVCVRVGVFMFLYLFYIFYYFRIEVVGCGL